MLINPEDFENISLEISIYNETSKSELRGGYRFFGFEKEGKESKESDDLKVDLVELLDEGMILDMPQKSCSLNHILKVDLAVKGRGNKSTFVFRTCVKDIQKTPTKKESVTLELSDPEQDGKSWMKFNEVYMSRQNEIVKFLKDAKG